jgi:hypothetical protein
LKPSVFFSTVEALSEGRADASSKVIPRAANPFEGEAAWANPETGTAA